MKNSIRIIIACLFFLSCSMIKKVESSTSIKKVFLFAGQSNMDGRANGAQLTKMDLQRLSKVANRISFYYNHQPVTPLQLTTASKHVQKKFSLTESFGPELFFGIEMAEKYPEDEFVFIKRSQGGTSLYGCWNPDWSEEKAALMNELKQPKLYFDFIAYAKDVLKEYNPAEYEIKGMLWVQGEADSGVKKWGEKPAEAYGENLSKLIESTRTSLDIPEMPFVLFQVGFGKVVKGMKKTAENDNHVYLIPQSNDKQSKDFYKKNPPPVGHYTAKSMKRIGMAFFKIFESI